MYKSLITILFLLALISCTQKQQDSHEDGNIDNVEAESTVPGEIASNNVKKDTLVSAQLDAFALTGDVHTVKYDSLILKYDREGNLEYFGFNDSINLFKNVVYDGKYIKSWGDNGWKFKIISQPGFLSYYEEPISEFQIHDPHGGAVNYFMTKKTRPGSPDARDRNPNKPRTRTYTLTANFSTYNYRGSLKPDIFTFSDYKYDHYGNWIERKVKSEHNPTRIDKREITYYSDQNSK